MDVHGRLKRWFKLRFAILYPIGVYALFFGMPDDKSLQLGTWFILSGLFLRLWANGYAVKLKKLTTSGPYAFLRHPLYLGTILLAVGFIIMLKIYYIGMVFMSLIAVMYCWTMKKEEKQLEEKFGKAYINYKRRIPMLLPTIFPYREGEKWQFNFRRLIKSQEYKLFLWTIALVIAFHLKDEFMIEKEPLEAKYVGLIILVFVLPIVDLVGEYVKARKKLLWRKNTGLLKP